MKRILAVLLMGLFVIGCAHADTWPSRHGADDCAFLNVSGTHLERAFQDTVHRRADRKKVKMAYLWACYDFEDSENYIKYDPSKTKISYK